MRSAASASDTGAVRLVCQR